MHIDDFLNKQRPFGENYSWQRKFIPYFKRIAGECFICEAPKEEDCERNTDLIVLKLDAIRISCRVRRFWYVVNRPDYLSEYTIRSKSSSNQKTELSKIIEGWGDYFFYAFSNEEENGFYSWFIGDLKVWRLWFNRKLVENKGVVPGFECPNGDGTALRVFSNYDMPFEFFMYYHQPKGDE